MSKFGIKVFRETEFQELVTVNFQKQGRPAVGGLRTDLVVSKAGLPRVDELDEIAELKPLDASMDPHKIIDGSLSILTGALTIGFAFVPGIGIAAMMGLGGLLAVGLKAAISKKDETGKQFEKLVEELTALDRKISNRFDEMEKFLVENSFGVEVVTLVTTLKRFMMDVVTSSKHEATLKSTDEKEILLAKQMKENAIENFRNCYRKRTPLNIGYILWSFLTKDATNPLLLALIVEKPDKNETEEKKAAREARRHDYYAKWKRNIQNLISELIQIELIAAGMFKSENRHDFEMLRDLYKEIELVMDKFEEKHKVGHWYYFKHTFFPSKAVHLDDNNAVYVCMESVLDFLAKFFPEDFFFVYTHKLYKKFGDSFYYRCPDKWPVVEYNKKTDKNNKFGVFIYRCRNPLKVTKEEHDELNGSFVELMKQKSLFTDDMRSTLNKNILTKKITVNGTEKNLIRQDGLVLAMKQFLRPGRNHYGGGVRKSADLPGRYETVDLGYDEKTHETRDVLFVVAIP